MTYKKKLIEVALPLDAINAASAREKSIRHGHPSTLHLWWARRPLAACRAVLFAQMVDDPSAHPDEFPTEEAQQQERERLFRIIEQLVLWENTNNEAVLEAARAEIRKSAPPGGPPPVLDPFAGGGSIPLEAQRLGLEAHASDLNPVAVLINKALIEIPPKFAGEPPVNPAARKKIGGTSLWKGAAGLAEDVRYYGQWMRDEAERRIGHLYPKVKLPKEQGGGEAMVIAWLWARTVTCPNPACRAQMPLVRSFSLSTKVGNQVWVEPKVDSTGYQPQVRFEVKMGRGIPREGTVNRRGAICICCEVPVAFDYIRAEGKAGRMGARLMAIVAEGRSGRIYVAPNAEHEVAARQAKPRDVPDTDLPERALGFRVQLYGMTKHRDLFTYRQLVTLTTFTDLVQEARAQVEQDCCAAGLSAARAGEYADAVATYLAFAVDKMTTTNTTICTWQTEPTRLVAAFSRQTIPMVWDFAEANPLSGAAGDYQLAIGSIMEVLERLSIVSAPGYVRQHDATLPLDHIGGPIISTDPPYYDNVGYADLSDYFYVWLRRSLLGVHTLLFSTLLVPKVHELVATSYRFDGDKNAAREFFEQGLQRAFEQMRQTARLDYPLTVYYAFKQSEAENSEDSAGEFQGSTVVSTGWETMLEGLIRSGFQITGTWPMRTELTVALKKRISALASSIILVCRPKFEEAPLATRREFLDALKRELPAALKYLQQGNIAPVDLAQASIGPGMAIYSRYNRVLEGDGFPMRVRIALALINQALDEYLAEQEGEYDADTRWAVAWFEQHGFDEGVYGDAETLSKAKNTAVAGMVEAGFLYARAGKVRLLRREELDPEWTPARDKRRTAWEVTQHLIHALQSQGEDAAAALLVQLPGGEAEAARDLAYRLYSLCERKGWAQEAIAYNSLVVAWPDVQRRAQERLRAAPVQGRLGM